MRAARFPSPVDAAAAAGGPPAAVRAPRCLRSGRVLRPGLSLYLGDAVEREDQVGHFVAGDAVRLVLVLGGTVDMRYGDRRIRLAGRPGVGPDIALVTLGEPVDCSRTAHRGDHARRVSIGLARPWVEQVLAGDGDGAAPGLEALLQRRFAARSGQAPPRARALAEQLLAPPPLPPALLALHLESQTIALVVAALAAQPQAGAAPQAGRSLAPAAQRRMDELRAFLERARTPQAEPSVEAIARQLGLGVTTLQRQFRQAHGITISCCLLQARLHRARQALEQEGASVARAAWLAGYTDPANFATAFKRRYGLPPSRVRCPP